MEGDFGQLAFCAYILNDEPLLMSISSDDFSIISSSAVDKVAMAPAELSPAICSPGTCG